MLQPIRHRKIAAVTAFACLLVFQAAGWFLACGILQFKAKKLAHVAIGLPETPLRTVTIPVDLLSEIRVGKKEIRLAGRLYDIKNQEVNGDSVTLSLYHDRHEEAALDALGSLLTPAGNPGQAHSFSLQNWLATWIGATFLPPASPVLHLPPLELFSPLFTCLVPAAQAEPGSFSPPPKGVSSFVI